MDLPGVDHLPKFSFLFLGISLVFMLVNVFTYIEPLDIHCEEYNPNMTGGRCSAWQGCIPNVYLCSGNSTADVISCLRKWKSLEGKLKCDGDYCTLPYSESFSFLKSAMVVFPPLISEIWFVILYRSFPHDAFTGASSFSGKIKFSSGSSVIFTIADICYGLQSYLFGYCLSEGWLFWIMVCYIIFKGVVNFGFNIWNKKNKTIRTHLCEALLAVIGFGPLLACDIMFTFGVFKARNDLKSYSDAVLSYFHDPVWWIVSVVCIILFYTPLCLRCRCIPEFKKQRSSTDEDYLLGTA